MRCPRCETGQMSRQPLIADKRPVLHDTAWSDRPQSPPSCSRARTSRSRYGSLRSTKQLECTSSSAHGPRHTNGSVEHAVRSLSQGRAGHGRPCSPTAPLQIPHSWRRRRLRGFGKRQARTLRVRRPGASPNRYYFLVPQNGEAGTDPVHSDHTRHTAWPLAPPRRILAAWSRSSSTGARIARAQHLP